MIAVKCISDCGLLSKCITMMQRCPHPIALWGTRETEPQKGRGLAGNHRGGGCQAGPGLCSFCSLPTARRGSGLLLGKQPTSAHLHGSLLLSYLWGCHRKPLSPPRLPWVLQTRQGRGQAGKDHPRPHHGPPTWVAVLLWGWPHLDPLHAVLGRLGRHTLDLRLEPLPAEGHSHVSTLLDLGSGQHTPAQVVGQTCVGVNMCSPVCSPASEVGAKHGPWGRGQEGWHLSRKNLESDTREIVAFSC